MQCHGIRVQFWIWGQVFFSLSQHLDQLWGQPTWYQWVPGVPLYNYQKMVYTIKFIIWIRHPSRIIYCKTESSYMGWALWCSVCSHSDFLKHRNLALKQFCLTESQRNAMRLWKFQFCLLVFHSINSACKCCSQKDQIWIQQHNP